MSDSTSQDSQEPSKKIIKILLVDDHAIVRQGLRSYIELQPDMQVIAEGGNGFEAVSLTSSTQPDVILLDLLMPGLDGVEATRKIMQNHPQTRILILTSFGDDRQIFPAIRAGALGYLLKDIQPQDLIKAIRDVMQGKPQLHPDIVRRLMTAVTEKDEKPVNIQHHLSSELQQLTEREREVLEQIARGLSNREIAEKMFISEKTVKTHVSNVLDKLGMEDRTRAAIWALKHGLGSED
jgi:DNA-binding NarL/FixJ family response regulator